MTENELRQRPEFADLPIYGEADDRCDSLTRYYASGFDGTAAEATDDEHFWQLMQDPQMVPAGAIRYTPNDVRAVFWKKR